MERTFTFTVSATIDDPRAAEDLSDEDREDAQNAAVEAARASVVARYATVQALVDDVPVAEDDD